MDHASSYKLQFASSSSKFISKNTVFLYKVIQMDLQHFSHEHPLCFIKDPEFHDEDGNIYCCSACVKPITLHTPSYYCPECYYFLHKSCAELPQHKTHPLHPQHPLTLLPKPLYDSSLCNCDCCERDWGNFTYNCSICEYDLDITCASLMDHNFQHPCHQHPLTRTQREILTRCDGCNTKHEGIFYLCNTCPFMIHHECLSLPYRLDFTDHPQHTFTLSYSTPSEFRFWIYCEICKKKIDEDYAVYYCGECRYFVHTNCATSRYESFMSILLPWSRAEWGRFKVDFDRPGIVQMPVADESVNLIDHFTQGIAGLRAIEGEFIHFSHSHPLVVFDKLNDDDDENKLISEGKCCLQHNKKNDQLLCSACIRPIIIATTTPFYRCIEKCGFFLHASWAELPAELQHPGHPQHPLVLLPRSPTDFGVFKCKGCTYNSNGFVYSCTKCDDYKLDVVCGSLPKYVQHEAHKEHILSIKPYLSTICSATNWQSEDAPEYGFSFAYQCESCNFEVLPEVMQLRRKMRHRYDEGHPYILTYSTVDGSQHWGEYLCDICEKELNPKWWFYHCVDCDHSIHHYCLPQFDYWSHKKYGGRYRMNSHPHPLIFLPLIKPNTFFHRFPHVVITDDTECDTAGECCYWGSSVSIFKCEECSFKLHYECVWLNGDLINDDTE